MTTISVNVRNISFRLKLKIWIAFGIFIINLVDFFFQYQIHGRNQSISSINVRYNENISNSSVLRWIMEAEF